MSTDLPFPACVPKLTDGVVRLRAHHREDVPRMVQQVGDAASRRWLTVAQPYGEHDAHAFLDEIAAQWALASGKRFWAIEEVDRPGLFLGTVDVHSRLGLRAEIGFGLHPEGRGRGLMTRAVRLVVAQAFTELGVSTVGWRAAVGNWASRRVAWAAGFTIDGTWRGMHAGLPPEGRERSEDLWVGSLRADDPLEPQTPWCTAPVIEPAAPEGAGKGGADGVTELRLRPVRDEDRILVTPLDEGGLGGRDELAERFNPGVPTAALWDARLLRDRGRAASGELIQWCIADRGSDAPLGIIKVVGLGNRYSRTGTLGYFLVPSARGRGLLGRAIDAVVGHALAPTSDGGLGLTRLAAQAGTDNIGSMVALRRSGFRQVGVERSAFVNDAGQVQDDALFELLAADDRDAQRSRRLRSPILETPRLRLRPWRDSDREAASVVPDESARRWMPSHAMPGPDGWDEWLLRRRRNQALGRAVSWCIADKDSDLALGDIGLFTRGDALGDDIEIGYWLLPGARGQRLLTEAIDVVLDHAFTPAEAGGLGARRVHADTDLENVASQTVLDRAGLRRWGVAHGDYIRDDGSLSDSAYYELSAQSHTQRKRERSGPGGELMPGFAEVIVEGDDGVRLRPWRGADAARVVEACTDEQTRHWLPDLPAPYALRDAQDYIRRTHKQAQAQLGWYAAIVGTDDDRILGSVSVMNVGSSGVRQGEVGYWMHPDARGRGILTAAVGVLVRHAFTPRELGGLGLERLTLRAAPGNGASVRVAGANGFRRIGVERGSDLLGDGTRTDLVTFDLLPQDLR